MKLLLFVLLLSACDPTQEEYKQRAETFNKECVAECKSKHADNATTGFIAGNERCLCTWSTHD